jgi:DNA invertase Pin-like site-specific DNA recombinase
MSTPALLPTLVEDRPEKLHERHLERLAVVYIRQSSMAQVHHNQESTKLQYSLVGMAQQFGWARERILVIDDDLGVSGASAQGRQGFQRLLTEVALDHVGIILGVEMSRLARSNMDWHQLLELCARFGTLIADLDGLYDPSRYNDRLLLGLKGTMSEAELHILRQRLLQGRKPVEANSASLYQRVTCVQPLAKSYSTRMRKFVPWSDSSSASSNASAAYTGS